MPVPGGFVLFRVLTRTTSDPAAFQAQAPEITDSLRAREAERLVRATLAQLRSERKVEINDEALRSFLPEERTRG